MIIYLRKYFQLDYKMWDLNTITASDFTVSMALTKEHWSNWVNLNFMRKKFAFG